VICRAGRDKLEDLKFAYGMRLAAWAIEHRIVDGRHGATASALATSCLIPNLTAPEVDAILAAADVGGDGLVRRLAPRSQVPGRGVGVRHSPRR
jgi:hypothetical protein